LTSDAANESEARAMDHRKLEQEDRWRRELEDLKRDVNLVEYAKSCGYEIVRRKSSRASKVLRHPQTDHRIVVARDAKDDHWMYYTIGGDEKRDCGSVVDFAQNRAARATLGVVRRQLRDFLGRPAPLPPDPDGLVRPSHADRAVAVRRFESAQISTNSSYLNERGLRPETLQDPRFKDSWRLDARGNVLFVHRDADGISGYEIKNRGFTGFASQGVKTAWHSRPSPDDTRMVIAETAIDALSYHQIHQLPNTRYFSTGGAPSPEQIGLLARAVARMPRGSEVVCALDADKGGDEMYRRVSERLGSAEQIHLRRHSPGELEQRAIAQDAGCSESKPVKDWNDVLQARERAFIARETGSRAPCSHGLKRDLER
jgi:hypothetical protein